MKKTALFIIVIIVCLAALWGCAKDAAEVDAQGEFCRVLCLKEDGIVVEIPDLDVGCVYVKHIYADLDVMPLDTVVMEFSESALESASGVFMDCFGEERTYSHILESPESIRFADTSEGEPTFG